MGGCRCSYKNCPNTTKTRENLHFFHYPVKQKERCRQWIENANKPQFYDLDEDQLRNKVICETHFEDSYFPNFQKKRLLQAAVPTLDGDCEQKQLSSAIVNVEDVQVLPASSDGTIFVVETNIPSSVTSEKVESYIYTNNGLVLPINKLAGAGNNNNSNNIDMIHENSQGYSNNEMNIDVNNRLVEQSSNLLIDSDYNNQVETINYIYQEQIDPIKIDSNTQILNINERIKNSSIENIEKMKTVDNHLIKKINQHSKDIALIKRYLKRKRTFRNKPNNYTILNSIKKEVTQTLFTVLSLNMVKNYDLSKEDFEFFSNIYKTSPEVYNILNDKYKWNLPNPEIFINSTERYCNGNICENK